jgi:hypothetical protein
LQFPFYWPVVQRQIEFTAQGVTAQNEIHFSDQVVHLWMCQNAQAISWRRSPFSHISKIKFLFILHDAADVDLSVDLCLLGRVSLSIHSLKQSMREFPIVPTRFDETIR